MEQLQTRRDEIAERYFDQLPFSPYPFQEDALLAWYTAEQGILACAPTGMGKTLVAEAAIFESLHLGKTAYYTTPLIALTDQKFRELQQSAVRWGFSADDVGLVTGNRKVNPDARILVVVAEILLNRLLHRDAFNFDDVWAVVMDEFHSFNDRERGIVWEFGLSLLPQHVRTLLISATVGNSMEFTNWLSHVHDRKLKLIQGTERKVPLSFSWVEDALLDEHVERMVAGDESLRRTPALIFCFNRSQCWTVAEQLKGKKVVTPEQQKQLGAELDQHDWTLGAGPKLKRILIRGIGVHHAGVLPRYRRIVEDLFQKKLLSFCVCTETLAAGINLPARSVVLPGLLKGPPKKKKLIEPSSAHQMFGRAGRPQYDDQGFVYALAHDDDVKILRWREKYDQIPEDTKDPGLRKAKKALKKKMPKRREGFQYWSEAQFQQLIAAPPADLASRGPLPWRLLVYMLDASSDVDLIRKLVAGRLLKGNGHEVAQKQLTQMLMTLWRGGYVQLEPKPPLVAIAKNDEALDAGESSDPLPSTPAQADPEPQKLTLDLGQRKPKAEPKPIDSEKSSSSKKKKTADIEPEKPAYKPKLAIPNESMFDLLKLRGVNPLYAMFLVNHLGIADQNERILAIESLLEFSKSVGRATWVPRPDELPSGPLATTRLDPQLLKLGLATAEELGAVEKDEDEDERRGWYDDEPVWVLTLPHKLQRLFQHDFPNVDVRISPVWVAGEVLKYDDFNKYITGNKLQLQEGVVFRHLLRMILTIDELSTLCPPDIEHDVWRSEIGQIADDLERICRDADSQSTDQWLDESRSQE